MNSSFDFSAVLRQCQYKKLVRPSVSGAQKENERLNASTKRKSNRLSTFDTLRKLPKDESKAPAASEAKTKADHRRQQLEKYKADKEQRKKEAATKKKKPFLVGVAQSLIPKKYVPPPTLPKPNSSGRVTRSQTRSLCAQPINKGPIKPALQSQNQSFAPKNAGFKPPPNIVIPSISGVQLNSKKATKITFDPILPNAANASKKNIAKPALTHRNEFDNSAAKTANNPRIQTRSTRSVIRRKPSPKKLPKIAQRSSSGSDIEAKKDISVQKSIRKPKEVNLKKLVLESSSQDSSSESSSEKFKIQKPGRKTMNFNRCHSRFNSEQESSDAEPKKLSASPVAIELSSENDMVEQSIKKTSVTPKSESDSEQKLKSPETPIALALTVEQMESAKGSPSVTVSRGKDNARKELKWKIDEGYLDYDEVSDEADNLDEQLSDRDHFRQLLSSEMTRLTGLCAEWDTIREKNVLPEAAQDEVLAAVGQARLLMSHKLQQFAALVERCGRAGPERVTPSDLHGFWEMVYMQVENVNMRFQKLKELQTRNWTEEKLPEEKKKVVAKPIAKKLAKQTAGPSKLREMIAAARRAKQVSQQPSTAEKTFEAGFFTVRSPLRPSPARPVTSPRGERTPNTSLLKAVLDSEAKKASSKAASPFAMLRASITAKKIECDGIAILMQTPPHLPPVDLSATPARSILKPATEKSDRKPGKVVLFENVDSDSNNSFSSEIVSDKFQSPENSQRTIEDSNQSASPIKDKYESLLETPKDMTRTKKLSPNSITRTRRQKKSMLVSSTCQHEMPTSSPLRRSVNNLENEAESTINDKYESLLETPQDMTRTKKLSTNSIIRTRRQKKSMLDSSTGEHEMPTSSPLMQSVQHPENEAKAPRRSSRIKKAVDTPAPVGDGQEDIMPKARRPRKSQTGVETDKIEVKTPRNRNRKGQATPVSSKLSIKHPQDTPTVTVEEKRVRSARTKALKELNANTMELSFPTPKRSSRKSSAPS